MRDHCCRSILALGLALLCLILFSGCDRTAEETALTAQLEEAQAHCAALEQETAALRLENQRLTEETAALQARLETQQTEQSLPSSTQPELPPEELIQLNLRELAEYLGMDLLPPAGPGMLSLDPAGRTDWQPAPEGSASVRQQINTTFSIGEATFQEIPPEQAAQLMVFLHLRFFLDAGWSQRMDPGTAFLITEFRDYQITLCTPQELPAAIPGQRVPDETAAVCEGLWYVLPQASVKYEGQMSGSDCAGWTPLFEDELGPIAFSLMLRNGTYMLMPLT